MSKIEIHDNIDITDLGTNTDNGKMPEWFHQDQRRLYVEAKEENKLGRIPKQPKNLLSEFPTTMPVTKTIAKPVHKHEVGKYKPKPPAPLSEDEELRKSIKQTQNMLDWGMAGHAWAKTCSQDHYHPITNKLWYSCACSGCRKSVNKCDCGNYRRYVSNGY